MRVVAGTCKGRFLEAVPGHITRPTSNKVKEAAFQIMGPFFEKGNCLDLFAGSGSLGIEALSRGIHKNIFVDNYSKAVQTIQNNVQRLKLENQVEIFRTEAFRALNAIAKRDLQFDLILLDPPYQDVNYQTLLESIGSLQLLKSQGMLLCEHDGLHSLPRQVNHLFKIKEKFYNKTTGMTIFQAQ